jgi:hypothetical protein
MLWNTLKTKIADYALAERNHDGARYIRSEARYSGKTVAAYLDTVDIRNVGKLRELVPEAFPKKLRKGILVCDTNIHGKWRVHVAAQQKT